VLAATNEIGHLENEEWFEERDTSCNRARDIVEDSKNAGLHINSRLFEADSGIYLPQGALQFA